MLLRATFLSFFIFLGSTSFAETQTLTVQPHGAAHEYQMSLILHKGTGARSLEGRTLHVYSEEVDARFSNVKFTESDGNPILYRRLGIRDGVSATFVIRISTHFKKTKTILMETQPTPAASDSTDEALNEVLFDGPVRVGGSNNGVIYKQWGVEQTMLYENGVFKSWYHGAPDSKVVQMLMNPQHPDSQQILDYSAPSKKNDYWNNPVIRYAESRDGITWIDLGVVLDNKPYFRACPFMYHLEKPTAAGEPAGYYLTAGRNGQMSFDLFYSTTGLPGSFKQLNNGNVILGFGDDGDWDEYRTGNNSFFYDHDQKKWLFFFEAADRPPSMIDPINNKQWFSWRGGVAFGNTLTTLVKSSKNPLFSRSPVGGEESVSGGFEVKKVGKKYFALGHSEDPSTNHPAGLTPTSNIFWSADSPEGPWTSLYWMTRIGPDKRNDAQIADPSWLEKDGETFIWYEDQPDQTALKPDLSLAIIPIPIERWTNPKVWTAKGEDLEAEGWTFDPGAGEYWPKTLMRKVSTEPSPELISSVKITTDYGRTIRARKEINFKKTENTFTFYAKAMQRNKRFIPLSLDADQNNSAVAGVYFDNDGMINYVSGNFGAIKAMPYQIDTWYQIQINQRIGGYDLLIDGKIIAMNIPYVNKLQPKYYRIEQKGSAVSYISTLTVTQYLPPAEAPQWML